MSKALAELDHILGYLYESDNAITEKVVTTSEYTIETEVVFEADNFDFSKSSNIQLALLKLNQQGYISREEHSIISYPQEQVFLHRITFDGIVFHELGGFLGQHEQNNRTARMVKTNLRLTVVIALGVITPSVYAFLEICQKKMVAANLSNLTLAFVFLAGSLIGICILLIASEILSRRSSKA